MPELPAVEFSRRLLEQHLLGHSLTDAVVGDDPIIFEKAPAEHIRQALLGTTVVGTGRHGKYLWLELSGGPRHESKRYLLMHFGMTGFVQVRGVERLCYRSAPETLEAKGADAPRWPPRFTKLLLETEAGGSVVFGDARRLGRIKILDADPRTVAPVKDLGFDPLLGMPPCDKAFFRLATARAVPLKSLLLDQGFAAGVGNWMADDIMLHARLHPEVRVNTLSPTQVQRLHEAIRYITETAVAVNSDGSQFPPTWLFHYRWPSDRRKQTAASLLDGQHPIRFITVGGRTTVLVPDLQQRRGEESHSLAAPDTHGSSPPADGKTAGKKRQRGKQ